jgi:hypothetical protein
MADGPADLVPWALRGPTSVAGVTTVPGSSCATTCERRSCISGNGPRLGAAITRGPREPNISNRVRPVYFV